MVSPLYFNVEQQIAIPQIHLIKENEEYPLRYLSTNIKTIYYNILFAQIQCTRLK